MSSHNYLLVASPAWLMWVLCPGSPTEGVSHLGSFSEDLGRKIYFWALSDCGFTQFLVLIDCDLISWLLARAPLISYRSPASPCQGCFKNIVADNVELSVESPLCFSPLWFPLLLQARENSVRSSDLGLYLPLQDPSQQYWHHWHRHLLTNQNIGSGGL